FLLLPATEAPRTTRRSTRSPLKPACPAPPEAPTVKMTRRVSEAFASPDWLVGRLSQAHQACCTEGAGARFPSKNNKQLK
ncbi:unnamed protein product, partial [Prorocentrum cordatum]